MVGHRAALAQLQTAEYIAQSRELRELEAERGELLGVINGGTQTLDSLTDCLSVSGLADVAGAAFDEWLCDIGMDRLQSCLKGVNGSVLTMYNVGEVVKHGVKFCDAAALQLRGFIAHAKLSGDITCSPPPESVLAWTVEQTANWIKSLGAYEPLAKTGWHGAALCSLTPLDVVNASEGAFKAADAAKFINLVRAMRKEVDGEKEPWVVRWSGANTIDSQTE